MVGTEFAEKILGYSVARIETYKFRDYWCSRAGPGGVKLDWSATWRNWIRTAAERKGISPELPVERPAPRSISPRVQRQKKRRSLPAIEPPVLRSRQIVGNGRIIPKSNLASRRCKLKLLRG